MLSGFASGLVIGFAWRLFGRVRWGALPFPAAVLVAARYTDRSDWPLWDGVAVSAAGFMLFAAIGAGRTLAGPTARWHWVAVGAVFSGVGVWTAVPETGPALLVGGAISGVTAATAWTSSSWKPSAGLGLAMVLGWAALSGAVGGRWATVGGVLCTGIAPWLALRPGPLGRPGRTGRDRWLLGGHALLVILGARWIGVAPHAGWGRVAIVGVAGLTLAVLTRSRA